MNFAPVLSIVTVKLIDGRYAIYNPKGIRVDSRLNELAAMKTAKRLFPSSIIKKV